MLKPFADLMPSHRGCLFLLIFLYQLLQHALAHPIEPLLQPLTTEQGLSRGSVNRLHIDKQGFLWIATSQGLNRYDATRNHLFEHSEQDLTELHFNHVFEDQQQRLWAIATNIGLFSIDQYTGESKVALDITQAPFAENTVLYDAIPSDNAHLLLAMNHSIWRFHIPSGALEKLFQLPQTAQPNRIRQLWLSQTEQLLLIGTNRGLYQFDLTAQSATRLPLDTTLSEQNNEIVRHIYQHQQQIFVAANNQLYQLQHDLTGRVQSANLIATGFAINRMLSHQQELLLATTQGLYQLSAANTLQPLWRFTQSNQQISADLIVDLVATADGGFWFASRDDGAYYWHPRSTLFQHRTISGKTDASLETSIVQHNAITSMLATGSDLWLSNGTDLTRYEIATDSYQTFSVPNTSLDSPSSRINRIFEAQDGLLWIRFGRQFRLYSPSAQQFVSIPKLTAEQLELVSSNVLGHWQDESGSFWFYNQQDYYVYQPNTGEITPLPGIKDALPIDLAGRFLGTLPSDPDQLLLTGADQLWLYQISTGRMRKVFEHSRYQPNLNRYADKFSVDPHGILWVTFHGIGLLGFDASTLELRHHFKQEQPLSSHHIFANQLDSSGNLWFSGQYGLTKLDTQNLRIEHFGKRDGLISRIFNYGASAQLPDGRLIFGHSLGFTMFDPQQLNEEPSTPKVVITSIAALNAPQQSQVGNLAGRTFLFDHETMGIEIKFSALHFRDSGKFNYRIRLWGEQELTYPDQSNPALIFPQLNPGDYWFEVIAVSPMTGLESPPAHIQIHITPAPWRSPAAISGYLTVGVILLLLWMRNAGKQKRLLANAHKKIKASEQRLKQALEAVDSGAWEWHANKNSMYALRVHSMLGYNEELNPLSLQQHLSLIHPDDREHYQQAWQKFLSAPDKGFDHTYRMQHKINGWLWFRDIGKVTEMSDDQKIERVLGTYSNITETRATKEKARLFGEAFQQTRDWVVLLDLEQRVIAANLSFCDVFGNMDDYLTNPRQHHLGISPHRRQFYQKMLASMTVNQHWQGEELVQTPNGEERPILINITAVGEDLQVEFFVLVFTDITAQKQAEEELRYLASYDTLTGLPNRALLMDRIYHGIEKAKRERRSLALCFIDLDKFKQINDSLGHDIGDQLLKKVAARLTEALRLTDSVARLGGDEFVVLLEGYKNNQNISHVARKMIRTIGEPMQLGSHTVSVSPSIGIAIYPEDAHDAKELLKHADVAMYHAKDSGRNNFQFFINEMNEKAYMQLARETQLRSGFNLNEFINVYQPVYDSRTQQIVGAEVLMRWHTEQGMVPPAEFIALAEDLRLIVPMTQALLERALADLQQWHQQGFHIYLSVNLSIRHLEQEDLAEQTALLLERFGLPASCLKFEVTESALMEDHASAIATMLALSALGIQLALDDFGTGYSSLKYLKELPIDAIKIDRSFVKDIGIDSNDETIIDAMLSMANSLGMYCIAEGVETEQQLAFFTQRQCFLIQGYLFGKPMSAPELQQRLIEEAAM